MKAKQYHEKYLGAPDKEEVLKNMLDLFIQEVEDLAKARRSTSISTYHGIVRELDLKWRALADLIGPHVKKTAFYDYAIFKIPNLVSGAIKNGDFIAQRVEAFESSKRPNSSGVDSHQARIAHKKTWDPKKESRRGKVGA